MSSIDLLVNAVRSYLDANDWNYDYEERGDNPFITFGLNVKCKLNSLKYFIAFRENGFTSIAVPKLNATPEVTDSIIRYLTMANYGLLEGNFEFDVRDGEIRYKVYTNTRDLDDVSEGMIEDAILIPAAMFERYGDGIAALLMGFSDPETEIKNAEG